MSDFLAISKSLANGDVSAIETDKEMIPIEEVHAIPKLAVRRSLVNDDARFWCTQLLLS